MGFFKDLFFKKEKKEETQIEKQVQEHAEDYSQATTQNIPICNGCGQDILNKPRIRDHMGKTLYFHKRCWKSLKRGELPKPIDNNDQQEEKDI